MSRQPSSLDDVLELFPDAEVLRSADGDLDEADAREPDPGDTDDPSWPREFSDPTAACPHEQWTRVPDPDGETAFSEAEANQCLSCGLIRRRLPLPPLAPPHGHEELVAKIAELGAAITKASTWMCARLPRPERPPWCAIHVEQRELLRVHAELTAAVTALKALERHVGKLARS
jgi:hypothetical protein